MILVQNLIIHSTDGVTEYPDPKTFIESLSDYMKVEAQLPNNLSMMSIGQDAPDQQYQDTPWLQLDESNNPLALKYYNGVEWAETRPYKTIQAPYEGFYIQYGKVSYTHKSATADTWIDSMTLTQNNGLVGQFLFPEPFKSGTNLTVQMTPVFSSIFRDAPNVTADVDQLGEIADWIVSDRREVQWVLGANVDTLGFNIKVKTSDAIPSGATFTFNWMAIGEKV